MINKNTIILIEISEYLDDILDSASSPEQSFLNGLSVVSNSQISKICGIVSPNMHVFKIAKKYKADLIVAHHGLFKINSKPLEGTLLKRVSYLINNNISFMSYHIPLDVHPIYGNNAQIGKLLNLTKTKPFGEYHNIKIGIQGYLKKNITNKEMLSDLIHKSLNVYPVKIHWPKGKNVINKMSVISGGGARLEYLEESIHNNCDCYITGNIDEGVIPFCDDSGLVYVALGHYNSENFGVKALGSHLQDRYNVQFNFIEDNNEKW